MKTSETKEHNQQRTPTLGDLVVGAGCGLPLKLPVGQTPGVIPAVGLGWGTRTNL